ncbi:MAG: VIT1/CCC1 transporter family protein [Hydrogenophilaceae bacterium]|nr:VIT1/CCC1 transporter family protein [Hydrogenophilaceae bacterium]
MSDNHHALEGWAEEKSSAYLYRAVARAESGTPRQALFEELAEAAEAQASIWADLLAKQGQPLPEVFRPSLRTRLVARLTQTFSPRTLRPVLAAMKVRGMSLYTSPLPHRMPVSREEIGGRHRTSGAGNTLRAAVFGVNDGLVSNAALILGVAGATADHGVILLTGSAGLLAGALSMAAGEYVSVRSQREMFEYQIGLEREELEQYPQEEAAELALIYAAKGIPKAEAESLANRLLQDPERALDTLAREELGLNPDELGSPWKAAAASFTAFAAGAFIPLVPYAIRLANDPLVLSIGLTGGALFGVGALLSLFTGRQAVYGGLRMMLIGGLAGAATYFIGKALGISLG